MCATTEGEEILWKAACLGKDDLYKTIVSRFNTSLIESKSEVLITKYNYRPK